MNLRKSLQKLADCRDYVSRSGQCSPFVGLFSFEHDGEDYLALLDALRTAAAGAADRVVHCASLGTSLFARHWFFAPEEPNLPVNAFRAYKLQDMAPAYFVHNAIEYLCERSVLDNNQIWYPAVGKEAYTLGQIPLEGA